MSMALHFLILLVPPLPVSHPVCPTALVPGHHRPWAGPLWPPCNGNHLEEREVRGLASHHLQMWPYLQELPDLGMEEGDTPC